MLGSGILKRLLGGILLLLGLTYPCFAAITNLSPAQVPLTLLGTTVDVECYGSVAETTVRMSFYNPNPWQVGTEVDFRIANGCTLTGFALEGQNGVMRKGVPIDRLMFNFPLDKPYEAGKNLSFLQEIRDDHHKFRIFPVEPHSTRTMEMRHVGDLLVWDKKAKDLYYNLPIYGKLGIPPLSLPDFQIERPNAFFNFKMNVHGHDAPPYALSKEGKKLFFAKSGDVHTFEYSFDPEGDGTFNEVFDTVVNVVLPGAEKEATWIQSTNKGSFFYSAVDSALIAPLIPSDDQPSPTRVGIAWDCSLSGRTRDRNKEFQFLDAYFKDLLSSKSTKEVLVYLLCFRNDAEKIREFVVDRSSGWEKLRKELSTVIYDGATNFCAVRAEMGLPVDEWLLFSDGDENYGLHMHTPNDVSHGRGAPVHTVTSEFPSSVSRLSNFSSFYGGVLVDLTEMRPMEAVRYLRIPRVHLATVEGDGLTELLPSTRTIGKGESLVVAGRRTEKAGTLRLAFKGSGKDKRPLFINIPVSAANPESPLAALEWARMKKGEILSQHVGINTDELRRLGRDFGVISPGTAIASFSEDILPQFQMEYYYKAKPQELRDTYPIELLKTNWAELLVKLSEPDEVAGNGGEDGTKYFLESNPKYFLCDPILRTGVSSRRTYGDGISYLEHLMNVPGNKAYDVYLSEMPFYWKHPDFFLDTSDVLFKNGFQDLGLRVLSNLVEIDPENKWVARTLAYRLMELGSPQARSMFKKILDMDTDDPQSYRDLAALCAYDGDMGRAAELLYFVATHTWGREYKGVQLAALREMNVLLGENRSRAGDGNIAPSLTDFPDLDIRATLAADRGNSNLTFILTDEEGNQISDGVLSFANVFGSGTGELIVPEAKSGKYLLKVGYAGESPPVDRVPTLVLVSLETNVGRKIQNMKIKTAKLLPGMNHSVTVMEFNFDAEQSVLYKKENKRKFIDDKTMMILFWGFLASAAAAFAVYRRGRRK